MLHDVEQTLPGFCHRKDIASLNLLTSMLEFPLDVIDLSALIWRNLNPIGVLVLRAKWLRLVILRCTFHTTDYTPRSVAPLPTY